jgi:hypothetical protein
LYKIIFGKEVSTMATLYIFMAGVSLASIVLIAVSMVSTQEPTDF